MGRARACLVGMICFLVGTCAGAQAPDPAAAFAAKLADAESLLLKESAALVDFAVKQGLFAEARIELNWLREFVPDPAQLAPIEAAIPAEPSFTEIAVYLAKGKAWAAKCDQARDKVGARFAEVVALAKTAATDQADALLDRGLRIHPDSKALRKLRGESMAPVFGWVPDKDLPLLKKGMIKDGELWIPRSEAAKRHTSWDDPWIIETPHFQVHSNVSLDDAYMIGRMAEMNWDMFFRVFSGYPAFLKPTGKLRVYFFASIDDAVKERKKIHTAQPDMPSAAFGYYAYEDLAAHFWVTGKGKSEFEEFTRPTIHHEIGHQLAHNLLHGPILNDPQKRPEFWLVEGLGVYFDEVGEDKAGLVSMWNYGTLAFRGILQRGIERNYMPFEKYMTLQGEQFYKGSEDDIKNHYGQAGLMVHFFLFGEKGKYRAPFMEYAKIVNEGGGEDGLLAKKLGVPLAQLEREWLAFVKKMGKGGK